MRDLVELVLAAVAEWELPAVHRTEVASSARSGDLALASLSNEEWVQLAHLHCCYVAAGLLASPASAILKLRKVPDSWTFVALAGYRDLGRTTAGREGTVQEPLDAGDMGVGAEARLEGIEMGTLGGDLRDRSEELAPWVQEVQEGEAREARWVPSLAVVVARGDQGLEQLPGADGCVASRDGQRDKTEEPLLAASDRV
jgi:hypothetical protein